MEETNVKNELKLKRVSWFKRKVFLITAFLCLVSMFTSSTFARTEVPENLIEEKENNFSSFVLTAGETPKKTYTTPGTYTWTVPDKVTIVTVEIAGAGGGGGVFNTGNEGPYNNNWSESYAETIVSNYKQTNHMPNQMNTINEAGSGGNGDLIKQTIIVKPGQKYTIKVGQGGQAGYYSKRTEYIDQEQGYATYYTPVKAADGGNSSFGTVIAGGGKGAPNSSRAGNMGAVFGPNGANAGNGNGQHGGKGQIHIEYGYDLSNAGYLDFCRKATSGANGYIKLYYTEVETGITLKSNYVRGQNYVPLSWVSVDQRSGYQYDLYKKQDVESRFTSVKTNLTSKNTTDTTAKDKAAPVVSASIAKISGDKSKVNLNVTAEDKGTKYQHYVIGNNTTYGVTNIKSNTVTTTVITDIKGYSWVIDNKSNTTPDNSLEALPSTISVNDINCGKWIHIKAVDNAGNWSTVKHLELKMSITLGISAQFVKAENKIPVSWTVDLDNGNYTYRLYKVVDKGIEELATTTQNKAYTITKADKAAPNMPKVTANKKEDNTGFNITVAEATDNGTTYTFRVETTANETTYRSGTTALITATTGIQGYQYAVTQKSTHTFSNETIYSLEEVTARIQNETNNMENAINYLHIRSVDGGGLFSKTNTIALNLPIAIKLSSDYRYGMNEVPLRWTINDKRAGYRYEVYRKQEGESKYKKIEETSNSVKTLISSENKSKEIKATGTQTWTVPDGVTSITVTAAAAGGGGSGNWTGQEEVGPEGKRTKSYTNPGTYTWTVPAGVTSITVKVAGAGGGGSGNWTGQIPAITTEQKTENFTTPGTYTWTAPAGVTSVNATIAGAGGGRWTKLLWRN